jgi:hypothetical protein
MVVVLVDILFIQVRQGDLEDLEVVEEEEHILQAREEDQDQEFPDKDFLEVVDNLAIIVGHREVAAVVVPVVLEFMVDLVVPVE